MEGLGVSGKHVESESREHRLHIDEVIVQANRLLANPEAYGMQQSPEMRSLHHLNLDSNHMFLMLKRQLGKYYEEKQTLKSTMHPDKSEKWKEVLYASLLRALMELTFAVDKDQQLTALNHIYKWYLDKTRIDLPQIAKQPVRLGNPLTPKPTTVISQDNTMKARRERLLVRQMDAVRSIESRSPSPTRTSPTLDRTQPLFAPKLTDSYHEDRINGLFVENKEMERGEERTSQVHHKLMAKWSLAKSRLDERFLAKAEYNAVKPNIKQAIMQISDDSEEDSDREEGYRRPLRTSIAHRAPVLVDFRNRTQSASPVPEEDFEPGEGLFKPLTKVERVRMVNSHVIHTHTGSLAPSPDRLSLSFYTAAHSAHTTARSITPASTLLSQREDRKRNTLLIADIRRKLASRQIPCTFRTLSTGLVRPEDLPSSLLTSQFLPIGDEYLTSNPFSSLGKKKTKKKGKKKR